MENYNENEKKIEQIIAEKGEIISSTQGVSMYPMLRNRKDMVVIEKPSKRPAINDVVLYRAPGGKLLLHRIIKDLGTEYIIRGDNRLNKEYGVTPERIIGVLKGFYRDGKYYDCKKSLIYRIYVLSVRPSYPFRFLWQKFIRPVLSKLKRILIKSMALIKNVKK